MAEDRQLNSGKFNSNMQDQHERKNNGHVRSGGKGSAGGKSQVIYRPGSGPLKKTGEADNITEHGGPKAGAKGSSARPSGGDWRKPSQQLYQPPVNNSRESTPGPPELPPEKALSIKMSQLSTADNDSSDDKKKSKKPELAIYVPRPKAQAMAEGGEEPWEGQGKGRGQKKMTSSNSWEQQPGNKGKAESWDRPKKNDMPEWRKQSNKEQGRKVKGFGKRGQADDTSWRSQSPLQRSESMSGLSPSRDLRQTSEPRSLPFDGRPVPGRGSEPPMKPPMGPPRGGRGAKPNMQSLPPRFQKMQKANDEWDGNKSLVFQGHSHTLPHPPRNSQQGQGRGGDRRHEEPRNARSATPDQFKRPKTPPHHGGGGRGRRPSPSDRRTPSQDWSGMKSPFGMRRTPSQESVGRRRGKHRNRYNSGGSSLDENGGYRDRRHSDPRVTPQPSAKVAEDKGSDEELGQLMSLNVPEITDWSAEVEESDRLEAEALISETESNAAKSEQSSKRKRNRRKKQKKGGERNKESTEKSPAPADKSPTPHKGGLLILPAKLDLGQSPPSQSVQRTLYDPNNPSKPIMMKAAGMRMPQPQFPQFSSPPEMGMHGRMPAPPHPYPPGAPFMYGPFTRPEASIAGKPLWYDHYSENFRNCRNPHLLIDIEQADWELTKIISTVGIVQSWPKICQIRQFLLNSLMMLLLQDLRFSQMENIEIHIWKLAFYQVIELLRKGQAEAEGNQELKELHKKTLLAVIEDGIKFFDNLLTTLQDTYKFSVEELTGEGAPMLTQQPNQYPPITNLAIISAQKVCLYMGDLARYKEQANDTSNFNKAKQWYTKAQMLNPKNGRPYNQLAVLALHARRKLDAVYFYMRSLMASNPFQTARESLLLLFDENRKKVNLIALPGIGNLCWNLQFESLEKKRRDEQAAEEKERLQEKAAVSKGHRREIWIHPDNSSKEWLTPTDSEKDADWREEELSKMSFTELNKQFLTSYLHVQGKLFTKIGMETFQEAAHQMLREFRALLQHSPVPVSSARFLQLLALNMFAIENTQLKERNIEPGYRSVMQENALIVSLQMFNLILERCADLFPAPAAPVTKIQELGDVSEDLQTLLPAIKVWCDWLLCHTAVWNPPPSCADYIVGPPGDAWTRLANLVNRLERLDLSALELSTKKLEGFEVLKLPEDMALAGFTPLMYNMQELVYVPKNLDMELAYNCLRIKKVQFFGSEFLCGVDPPVLKLQRWDNERSLYISLVDPTRSPGDTPPQTSLSDLSDLERKLTANDVENGEAVATKMTPTSPSETSSEIKSLLSRKEELTRAHQMHERHRQQAQAILDQQAGCVEMKVRPRLLIPDTNCFIDHLEDLQQVVNVFTLMVPLVVLHELEGLARGSRSPAPLGAPSENAQHTKYVAERAGSSLAFLKSRPQGVRCVTTKGAVLAPTGVAMVEDSGEQEMKNDDRILNTCLSLIKTYSRGDESTTEPLKPGETRHLFREVVLLTEDRNLRVKCLARDVPVRTISDFLKWANPKP
ncbi:telomerase-binding protein EST1A isoform X2 [Neocloeon triangulifer]|uniref:telomerase-binding protein EST1A isoform X2 n=1 Tax=Neocloeon triangulifer TaxID=2078957 RepID=UPI00286FA604|nr:telomerase-binding protein EST1A isoform X2 [Neocloeon triangulifer]